MLCYKLCTKKALQLFGFYNCLPFALCLQGSSGPKKVDTRNEYWKNKKYNVREGERKFGYRVKYRHTFEIICLHKG